MSLRYCQTASVCSGARFSAVEVRGERGIGGGLVADLGQLTLVGDDRKARVEQRLARGVNLGIVGRLGAVFEERVELLLEDVAVLLTAFEQQVEGRGDG
jgi:hypothetical protein